jgi:DNA processing protein
VSARDFEVGSACPECLRRSWLLAELSAVLDRNCRADDRLFELLALEDRELIRALGGRRRDELERRHAGFDVRELEPRHGIEPICRHDSRYPEGLRGVRAPHLLHVSGGLARLTTLTGEPLVAVFGTRQASDYGIKLARTLTRELAASGTTVVTGRTGGIALSAQQGALEGNGATIQIGGDGLGAPTPKARRALYERLLGKGCAIAELPGGARGRAWGASAGERIVAGLGAVSVIVEAHDSPRELRGARIARELGRPVAALPGPVTSRTSSGCHALLREGARLVRDVEDLLDLLYGLDEPRWRTRPPSRVLPRLGSALRELLERVGGGIDTPAKLTAGRENPAQVLQELSELELLGLLERGDGGRYAICEARPG